MTIRFIHSLSSLSMQNNNTSQINFRVCFWFGVGILGTIFAQIFRMPTSSEWFLYLSIALQNAQMLRRPLDVISCLGWSIFSSVQVVVGAPSHGLSVTDSRPALNHLDHSNTSFRCVFFCTYLLKVSMHFCGVFWPEFTKNWITAHCTIFWSFVYETLWKKLLLKKHA